MSYMALYRKWRPDAFEEVKGQDHVVTTLCNQVVHNRIGHAYLFCGTRGTGKTTIARLFAKAINCENPREDGSPCGTCAMCQAISNGSSMNVIEIDAASNNGVDSIREITSDVQYSPTEGKYKVYIIDEAHMLTKEAFPALLKTLEEPPAYVVFILATTEYHKIPITVLSRCQRYDFHRIPLDTISARLMDLMGRENIPVEKEAIDYVAKVADGSMRDALSLLDQCIAYYLGQTLTYEKCLEVLGAVDVDVFIRLLRAVNELSVEAAVDIIDEIAWQGRDLNQFISDFTWFMRNVLLVQTSSNAFARMDYSEENRQLIQMLADSMDMNTLMRYIRIFSEVGNNIKYASQKRVVLELAVIKLCVPEMERSYDSILQRLDILSKKVEDIEKNPHTTTVVAYQAPEEEEEDAKKLIEELRKTVPPATMEELEQIAGHMEDAFRLLEPALANLLRNSNIQLDVERKSIVVVLNQFNKGLLQDNEPDRIAIEDAILQVLEKQVKVEFLPEATVKSSKGKSFDMSLFTNNNIPVELISGQGDAQ